MERGVPEISRKYNIEVILKRVKLSFKELIGAGSVSIGCRKKHPPLIFVCHHCYQFSCSLFKGC